MSTTAHRQPPAYALLGIFLLCGGVLLPLAYLLVRAFEANTDELREIVFRSRNLELLSNTLALTAGVLAVSTVAAFPLAWFTARRGVPGRRLIAAAGVLPLAIPPYLMAYALLGLGGNYGAVAQISDRAWSFPILSGYWGAVLVLALCNFPYLFLNFRAVLMNIDPALEEMAYSLGSSRRRVLMRVILPQLRPALLSGGLLVGLHVLSDFAVSSQMRYDTFSLAIFTQYNSAFDRTYAAWLALALLLMTFAALFVEARALRGLRLDRAGTVIPRRRAARGFSATTVAAFGFTALVVAASVGAPLFSILFWATKTDMAGQWPALFESLQGSALASMPAAVAATALAVPVVYLGLRRPSRMTRMLERTLYVGYATPALAFALGLVFFSIRVTPAIYQTLFLLVYAYTMRYMAEAVGPLRSTLYQASPRVEEAARSLGAGSLATFFRVTLPLLKNSMLTATAFVFLSCMKDLPLTIILSPPGYQTLAVDLWGNIEEAMLPEAAPYALAIVACSALFVGLLLSREKSHS